MAKVKAIGTTISYLPAYDSVAAIVTVGALTSVGEIAATSDEIDVTALDSTGGYKEFLQGARDSGEVTLNGFHDIANAGQVLMRTLFGTGATGYYWVTFPDNTHVIMTAFVKSYKAGPADVNGAVGFGATLRVTGIVQIISPALAIAQTIANGATATMESVTTALAGTPTYQWYSNNSNDYATPTIAEGETAHDYTTGALSTGTYYYFCVITVTGYKPVNSQIHVITVSAA